MLRYTIPLLLLATYGLQAQCQPNQFRRDVRIQLVRDSTANPDPACVAKGGQVRWCSNDGDWAVVFPSADQSPSRSGKVLYANSRGRCSAPDPVKDCKSPPCRFKYRSQVNPSTPIDPHVEVEP